MTTKPIRVIRGTTSGAAAAAGKIIRCNIAGFADEEIESVEVFCGHGISSVPDDDTECIALQWGHRTIIISTVDRRIAPAMAKGSVAIHTAQDQYVMIKKSGAIEIKTSGTVTVAAGTIKLGGESGLQALMDERFAAIYNAHTHPAPGGTTGAPVITLGDVPPQVSISAVSTTIVKGK